MVDDMMSSGAAFWLFLAVILVARMWRKAAATREVHATIRLAIEKNQPLDPAVVDKLLKGERETDPRIGAATLVAMGLAFPIMGYFLGRDGVMSTFYPLTGVGVLLLFMGVGQWVAWSLTRKRDERLDRFES